MHEMKDYKPKAAGQGICNECHAPKLACFKGALKEGACMLFKNNKPVVQIHGKCAGFIRDFVKKILFISFHKAGKYL
jgi:hypothetical protein